MISESGIRNGGVHFASELRGGRGGWDSCRSTWMGEVPDRGRCRQNPEGFTHTTRGASGL